ncbi:protein TolQ [Desulfovibrio psychrotolerans]|uniref:Protein TolQ n=1 Tax=Desulfovibrio psychrotolerans TaxID=415242 RepID=A0A7J0BTI5_9BACT|nr:protein TolQ [Desulfovibrio psychrotolerans]GFM36445.1 protein TolQ [Desulfovibrio psychrotolerans]
MGDTNVLMLLWQATLVVKFVLLLLVCMSVMSWSLMIQKWFQLSAAKRKASEGLENFQRAKDLREAVQALGSDVTSPVYLVAQEGVAEYNRLREMGSNTDILADNVRRALRQGVSMQSSRMGSSLAFLATTANAAPFIGLFGTVWGIMHSFHAIGQMKTASLAVVAPGISEALVATAIGLGVAIPATVGYNMFLGMLNGIEVQLVNFAGAFLNRVQRELGATRPASTTVARLSGDKK